MNSSHTALTQTNIQSIDINSIVIGERMRPFDQNAVDALARDIAVRGLLQPIAVKLLDGGKFRLIYGHHRLLAYRQAAINLPNFNEISAMIWSSDVPDWQVQLAEISENLCRKELTSAERVEQTIRAAAIYKEQGLVASVEERNAENGKASGRARSKSNEGTPCPFVHARPTVAEKLSSDLGIDKKTARRRVRSAAVAAGMENVTLETATPEELEQLADHAREQTKNKKPKTEKPKKKKTSSLIDDLIENFCKADEALVNAFLKADQQDDILTRVKISGAFRNAKSERSKILKRYVTAGYDAWGQLIQSTAEQHQDTQKSPMNYVKNRADEIIRMSEENAKKTLGGY